VCYKETAVIDLLSTEIEGRLPHLAERLDEWHRMQAVVENRA
jgi:hypothetical protein